MSGCALVRIATRQDARAIAEFAIKLFEQHRAYDPGRFADLGSVEGAVRFYGSRAEDPNAVLLIAEAEGRPIGYAYAEFERINYAELLTDAAWLHDIYLAPEARGTGAGRALLEAAANASRELGADKVVLQVAERNAGAQDFF